MEHVARGFIKGCDFMFPSKYNKIGNIFEQTKKIALLIIITYMRIKKGSYFSHLFMCNLIKKIEMSLNQSSLEV